MDGADDDMNKGVVDERATGEMPVKATVDWHTRPSAIKTEKDFIVLAFWEKNAL